MSPQYRANPDFYDRFPRVSGDEPDARKRWDQIIQVSPRERG